MSSWTKEKGNRSLELKGKEYNSWEDEKEQMFGEQSLLVYSEITRYSEDWSSRPC